MSYINSSRRQNIIIHIIIWEMIDLFSVCGCCDRTCISRHFPWKVSLTMIAAHSTYFQSDWCCSKCHVRISRVRVISFIVHRPSTLATAFKYESCVLCCHFLCCRCCYYHCCHCYHCPCLDPFVPIAPPEYHFDYRRYYYVMIALSASQRQGEVVVLSVLVRRFGRELLWEIDPVENKSVRWM